MPSLYFKLSYFRKTNLLAYSNNNSRSQYGPEVEQSQLYVPEFLSLGWSLDLTVSITISTMLF